MQLTGFSQDMRYALRSMRRHPTLTVATVLTLALGLGLNASVFTIQQGVLFRARVENNPGTFIHLSPEYTGRGDKDNGIRQPPWSVSTADYREYAAARSAGPLAAWSVVHVSLAGSGPLPNRFSVCW